MDETDITHVSSSSTSSAKVTGRKENRVFLRASTMVLVLSAWKFKKKKNLFTQFKNTFWLKQKYSNSVIKYFHDNHKKFLKGTFWFTNLQY